MVLTTMIKQLQYVNRFNEVFVLSLLILATNLAAKALFCLAGRVCGSKHSSNNDKKGRDSDDELQKNDVHWSVGRPEPLSADRLRRTTAPEAAEKSRWSSTPMPTRRRSPP
ncbi:MAG: hypothetical protein ACLUJG_07945 [Lawsonibacter sp.]